jgi:hypothetical protein
LLDCASGFSPKHPKKKEKCSDFTILIGKEMIVLLNRVSALHESQ